MGLISLPRADIPDDIDGRLLGSIEDGLTLSPRPYAEIAERIGVTEDEVLRRLQKLRELGVIKRFGVVVRHHELGYRANGMVVWDVPDHEVRETGRMLAQYPFVTLCYQRPRRLPDWPYNLFTMIHGKDRDQVLARISELRHTTSLDHLPHSVLFSRRRFKQRGARYGSIPGDVARSKGTLPS